MRRKDQALTVLFLSFLIFVQFCVTGASEEAPATRIDRVERGLLPPLPIQGQPYERMNLQDRMKHYGVPAVSVAIIQDYKLAWTKVYGEVRAGSGVRPAPDTPFQGGSIAKVVTAVITLRLMTEGRFALDDAINDVLKNWKLKDTPEGGPASVTVRHLLSHSAGLAPFTFEGGSRDKQAPATLSLLKDAEDAVRRASPPGERSVSSNSGYAILQQLVEDAVGRPFPEVAGDLFRAAGMENSSFEPVAQSGLFERAACGHDRGGAANVGKAEVFPAAVGGLWTTPTDLSRCLVLLFESARGHGHGFLRQNLASQMLSRQVENEGLGVNLEGSGKALRVLNAGGIPGFYSFMVGYPESGQGAVVMANSDGGRDLVHEVVRSIACEYKWADYVVERRIVAMARSDFAPFAGSYSLDRPVGMKVSLSERGGRYFWGDLEISPISDHVFVIPKLGAEIEMVYDTDGRVSGFLYGQPGTPKVRARRIP